MRYFKIFVAAVFVFSLFLFSRICLADNLDQQLVQVAVPYIKYFTDKAMGQGSGFGGFTRSFQLYLGGQTPADEAVINYGAASYDLSILGRIRQAGGSRDILDTYVSYATPQKLTDINNPVINCNGNFYGAGGPSDRIFYGLYRVVRIGGRDIPDWWNSWDWIVDTGATACVILDALEAYQETLNVDYKNFAILLGGYILKLQDSDGGIRYGPRGMYHLNDTGFSDTDFFWNLKSTEQNERCASAFEALYTVTGNTQYNQANTNIKSWLKSMYNQPKHLFHSAATFNGVTWIKSDIDGYVATDVTAFAPLEMMFSDTFFGASQAARDTEVDAMFTAIETKTAFLDANNKPLFFRFSSSQQPDPVKGDYGSVEWSAQMALGYLRAAQAYVSRDWNKTQLYMDKYYTLMASLRGYFIVPGDDPDSKVAPYASYYLDKSVAGNVPTGTGYYTFNCNATLAAMYYAFAEAGYDPSKLGGGTGIPAGIYNSIGMPWYQNTSPYNSTAAAVCQMILNFLRDGTGQPSLTQQAIYEYAKSPSAFGPELNPDEVDKALGHFDPYDTIISNSYDAYDSLADGNPYQGYNYSVDTYDPASNPSAMNQYMRDICHWMAYPVTRDVWWLNGALVVHPNTPAAIPLYGTYSHWAVVKGYAASANPCPDPRTNPWNTPDFTVYGFWIKDPLISGIGQDTYKTAAECSATYFKPITISGAYYGLLLQVAEPPPRISQANVKIPRPKEDLANLEFIGVQNKAPVVKAMAQEMSLASEIKSASTLKPAINKKSWVDLVPSVLLSDADCKAAFERTIRGKSIFVKRTDLENADYYLVPFTKHDKRGKLFTSAVIILDANGGYFKEASWSQTAKEFFKVNEKIAVNLVTSYALKDFANSLNQLQKLPRRSYLQQREALYKKYAKFFYYLHNAKAQLLWGVDSPYSASPYQPYWQIDVGGYIWYVTQDAKVIPENKP